MTLDVFLEAFQSATDMASRRDHDMEPMPPLPDWHSDECVSVSKKAVGELPACRFGGGKAGSGSRVFISIWYISAEDLTRGYTRLLIEPWNF